MQKLEFSNVVKATSSFDDQYLFVFYENNLIYTYDLETFECLGFVNVS